MIAVVRSATLAGATGCPVTVEVHLSTGLPSFTVVGLPDAAVRESRDRVRAALLSSGLPWPGHRVTVNLAPSSVRKAGSGLDLAIAVGVLLVQESVPPAPAVSTAFVGELGLDGTVRHVPGTIALADAVDAPRLVVPAGDVPEAAVVRHGSTVGVATLRQLADLLRHDGPWPAPASTDGATTGRPADAAVVGPPPGAPDLAEVRGQHLGRRAVEVAAAGGHHLLMVGPPGCGKTMLAERLPWLLPPLGDEQALEVTRVHSAAGLPLPDGGLMRRPPFRAPHHRASVVALVGGGGAVLRPGEISLATHGVLFLDEMGEFPSVLLDALRQPLEEGTVRVSRARGSATFPARFLLVGAMNPCPCGEGTVPGGCRCLPSARARYARRLSGPLLDRFDLVVPLRRPDADALLSASAAETSAAVAARVRAVRQASAERGAVANARLSPGELDRTSPLSSASARLLDRHLRAGRLSARGLDRVRRVARTIADLDSAPHTIGEAHVAEALAMRAGREVIEANG